jgi:hypothetical protein
MFLNNPEFHVNPYVGGANLRGQNVFLLMSEGGSPAVYNGHTAIFSSADAARQAYAQHIYRGKKTAPRLQVVNFGDLSRYPAVKAKIDAALAQYPGARMDASAVGSAVAQIKQKRAQVKAAAERASAAKRGGYTWPMIDFARFNLQIADGGIGPRAQAAYSRGTPETRITDALRAAGITPAILQKALDLFIPYIKKNKLTTAQKRQAVIRLAQRLGFSYTPVKATAKPKKGKAANRRAAAAPKPPRLRRGDNLPDDMPVEADFDFNIDDVGAGGGADDFDFDFDVPSPRAAAPRGRAGATRAPADDFDFDFGIEADEFSIPSPRAGGGETFADVEFDF